MREIILRKLLETDRIRLETRLFITMLIIFIAHAYYACLLYLFFNSVYLFFSNI